MFKGSINEFYQSGGRIKNGVLLRQYSRTVRGSYQYLLLFPKHLITRLDKTNTAVLALLCISVECLFCLVYRQTSSCMKLAYANLD